MSGLTPTGFVAPTTSQLLTSIEQDELRTVDGGIDTAPDQPLGQINGVFASKDSDVWQAQQECYGALDPGNAEGVQLDTAFSLTGVTRLPPSSTVAQNLTGSATPHTTFTGAVLDVNGNVVTPGQIIAQVQGHPEYGNFTNRSTFTVGLSGFVGGADQTGSSSFIAVNTGAIPCPAGTLTVITPPVTGLTSLSNPADGLQGSPIETDTQFRIRQPTALIPPNGATNDSMRATLLAVKGTGPGNQGIINATVFENDTNAVDGNGLPPHSTLAVIWDGAVPQAANNDIAQAIWNSKASGIQPYDGGSGLSGVAIDMTGASHTLGFARASQLTMYINITAAVDSTFDTVNGPAAIANLLANYGNTLVQGQSVVPLDFTSQARVNIKGVRNVTVFQIDSHAAPTNTAEILVAITAIARFSSANVAVTTTPFT